MARKRKTGAQRAGGGLILSDDEGRDPGEDVSLNDRTWDEEFNTIAPRSVRNVARTTGLDPSLEWTSTELGYPGRDETDERQFDSAGHLVRYHSGPQNAGGQPQNAAISDQNLQANAEFRTFLDLFPCIFTER